jgi:hypothetical protein
MSAHWLWILPKLFYKAHDSYETSTSKISGKTDRNSVRLHQISMFHVV